MVDRGKRKRNKISEQDSSAQTSTSSADASKKAQDLVDPGDAPALLFDQCCFCPGKKLPKRAGSLKDRGFYPRPDPPYPTHMKIVVVTGAADV